MIRRIIRIDEEKCTGCGLCAKACHEGAIDMVDGKARLVRESFCDGLGDCLPACPAGAISFEEREAPGYDRQAAGKAQSERTDEKTPHPQGGCPGKRAMRLVRAGEDAPVPSPTGAPLSRLAQWPCQMRLVSPHSPFLQGADLLIAADCTAYAYAGMHEDLMRGRVTVIGCPKLDSTDYSEKLAEILKRNEIRSVTLVRMEVPCCGGLQRAAEKALGVSGKQIPFRVVTVSCRGKILD